MQTATLVRRQHIEHVSQSMQLLCLHQQLASSERHKVKRKLLALRPGHTAKHP